MRLVWLCTAFAAAVLGVTGAEGGVAASAPTIAPAERDYMRYYSVEADFDEIWEFLQLAITGRGIKINNISHIGRMLRRTAEDVGATQEVFEKAKVVEFCSSTLSRRMMEADPHNIVFCPYIIAVYQLPEDPQRVHVAFRRPLPVGNEASQAALADVEKLLDSLIKEAIGP